MKTSTVLGAILLAAVGWLLWSQYRNQEAVKATSGTAPQTIIVQEKNNQSTPQDEFSAALGIVGAFFNGVVTGINQVANGNKNYTP